MRYRRGQCGAARDLRDPDGLTMWQHPPLTPDIYFPNIEPGEYSSYTYDAAAAVTYGGVVDPIVAMSISTEPSGAGEASVASLSLYGNVVTAWINGGVAGRVYTHQLVLTTQAGRVIPVLIGQVCDPFLESIPIPPAPVPGFGSPVPWVFAFAFDFSTSADSSYTALI